MFVDEVDILVEAGAGGAGCMSFRREKFVPRGGPDGGDGGKGGSVYAVASPHVNTLIAYRFNREFHARRGGHGQGSNRTGKDAPDIELEVPVGTLIYEKPEDSSDDARGSSAISSNRASACSSPKAESADAATRDSSARPTAPRGAAKRARPVRPDSSNST